MNNSKKFEQTDKKELPEISDEFESEYYGDDDDFRCGTCKGTGLVNPLTAPPEFFCVGTTDCPHCDGTGEI